MYNITAQSIFNGSELFLFYNSLWIVVAAAVISTVTGDCNITISFVRVRGKVNCICTVTGRATGHFSLITFKNIVKNKLFCAVYKVGEA